MTEESAPDRKGYDALMHEVCVGLGFCGTVKRGKPLHVDLFIPPRGMVTADQFAEWLVLADNMNPSECTDLMPLIRAAFVRHMGGEVVDAKKLNWSDVPADED
jgi:hypothetical protein